VTFSGDSIIAARELYSEYSKAVISEKEIIAKHTALHAALSILFPQGLPNGVTIEFCPDQGYSFRMDILGHILDVLGLSRLIIGRTTRDEDAVAEAMRRG